MAKDYEINVDAHPNIYTNDSRKLNIYFSIPEKSINKETGLLLFIPGFGGNANSNVYKKMRSLFADKYNVVTIQCDYFGCEFMQHTILEERPNNFNDMGLMQAIDNITSIIIVTEIIKDNGYTFNNAKIMAYGHSHGAYLAYLCNVFSPNLFSLIVDNSAWLFPNYLKITRALTIDGKRLVFDYIGRELISDFEIFDLPFLYRNFDNNCIIHSFHGSNDKLISLEEKRTFCKEVEKTYLHEITTERVDNKVFKSSNHGLNADFILLFDQVYSNLENKFEYQEQFKIKSHYIKTNLYDYFFDFNNKVPVLKRHPHEQD